MTDKVQDVRAPLCVRANQPDQQPVLASYRDPALLAKKGRLYVLCVRETPLSLLSMLYERYYTDPSFDIQPVLQRLLSNLCAEHPEARALIPLAVVLEGLNVIAVGTPECALWLDRFGGAKELLPTGREARTLSPLAPPAPQDPWVAAQYRLSAGDVLVLTKQAAIQHLVRRGWNGLDSRGSLDHMLRSVASRVDRDMPITLIGMPGFAPVADLGPVRRVPGAKVSAPVLSRKERSPVWPTLFVALVAVIVVFAVKRPTISNDSLIQLFNWILTPVPTTSPTPKGTPPSQTRTVVVLPTATPAPLTPTEEPTESVDELPTGEATPSPTTVRYPSPELIFPAERQEINQQTITLRWAWSGALADDEWFDVRMWREGMPKTSIAWTKERSYQERNLRPGWYHWTIVVVRADGRLVEGELCDEPTTVSFLVLEEGGKASTSTPTTAPTARPSPTPTTPTMPTRVTPVILPTRVTPSGDDAAR